MGGEFWAAIAGAFVGGIIAFGIQMVVMDAAARQRKKEKEERQQALGYSLFFKMVRIYSNIHNFGQHLEELFAAAKKDGFEGEPWQIYKPLANAPAPVHFSTDEMTMLLSLKDDDLFNELIPLDQVHNATLDIFHTLDARRQALTDMLPTTSMDGAKGEAALTEDQVMLIRPKMVEVNMLVVDVIGWCEKDGQNARELLTRLHTLLKEKVGLTNKLSFKVDG